MFSRCPPWLPRAVWTDGRRWRGLALANHLMLLLCAATLLIGFFVVHNRTNRNVWPLILAPFLLYLINTITMRWYTRRWITSFHRRLIELDLRLCLNCGYQLHGLPDAHTCPECSQPYQFDDLVAAWQRWIRHMLDLRLINPT